VGDEQAAASIERGDQGEDTDAEGDQLGSGQAEDDAPAGEPGELHRHQLTGPVGGVAAQHFPHSFPDPGPSPPSRSPLLLGGGGFGPDGAFGAGVDSGGAWVVPSLLVVFWFAPSAAASACPPTSAPAAGPAVAASLTTCAPMTAAAAGPAAAAPAPA